MKRDIRCSDCSNEVLEVDAYLSGEQIDGMVATCPECGSGKVEIHDDGQAAYAVFVPVPTLKSGSKGWLFTLLVLLSGCSGEPNLGALLGDEERCTLFGEYTVAVVPTNGCERKPAVSAWLDEDEQGTCAFRISRDGTGRMDCDAGEPTARCEGNVKVGECSYRMVWLLEQ